MSQILSRYLLKSSRKEHLPCMVAHAFNSSKRQRQLIAVRWRPACSAQSPSFRPVGATERSCLKNKQTDSSAMLLTRSSGGKGKLTNSETERAAAGAQREALLHPSRAARSLPISHTVYARTGIKHFTLAILSYPEDSNT